MDHSKVMIKVDFKNAIINDVHDELPAILPYVLFLLGRHHLVHKMTTGVPQGGSLSSTLFDMGIAPSIRRAQLALHLFDRR